MSDLILIMDFGGLHKELLARTVRDLQVYAEIIPWHLSADKIRAMKPTGIIITGNQENAPDAVKCDPGLFELGVPVLAYNLAGVPVPSTGNNIHTVDMTQTKDLQGIIKDFIFNECHAKGGYKLEDYISTQVELIRETTAGRNVLLALSGGVDSSVCAALLSKAIPGKLTCLFVDHGLMRQDEGDQIEEIFSKRDLKFIRIDAAERFVGKLKGHADPETKRKIIGEEFIRVFEEEAKKLGKIPFLAQGTIYPDIVESGGAHGATIKSHHNVGGLPENLDFEQIVEPLSGLFKNEVRKIGLMLGLPEYLVNRQPFPGPGLAVRIMGDVTFQKLNTLRRADAIVREELDKLPESERPDQYFAVLTDTSSVGVKGNNRTHDPVLAIRAVTTQDFMTCSYTPIPHELLNRMAVRISSEIEDVSRVVYDISSKPPGTIEWQ
ncbi:MAG: glutamine-hydrolyzing GMP synthase [Defluviitaleaceae bacterium]|nr:glutamine-hydrolyzing GMP synthase [Defluviitaleaceae bacterium]